MTFSQDTEGKIKDKDPTPYPTGTDTDDGTNEPSAPSGSSSGGYTTGGGYAYNAQDSTVFQGQETYFRLWGEYPPKGYIESLVKKGMNVYEIEAFERKKPAFKRSKTFENEWAAYAQMFSAMMGRR